MTAVIEQIDANPPGPWNGYSLRWVATEHGPIGLSSRGKAHVFGSHEEAGKWVDTNAEHGDFVIHGVKS